MPGTWSISTTLRNPERIRGFLHVLSRFEGKPFNETVQGSFFKELIRCKEYRPTGLSEDLKLRFEEPGEFTDRELVEILHQVHYENRSFEDDQDKAYAFRGRTAVSNMTKMGLAVAKESMGVVRITDLGKKLLGDEIGLADVFFRYFLKWQLPNPADKGYRGFDLNPFLAVLHVIRGVNREWEKLGGRPVGVSKEEFSLFLTTMTDYREIGGRIGRIVGFRQEKQSLGRNAAQRYVDQRFRETVMEVFRLHPGEGEKIGIKVNNLYDYADSAIRYFRQTKLLYYRGNGRYVDLAPTRTVEIDRLLEHFDGRALTFRDAGEYLDYMADPDQPALPWENPDGLRSVREHLLEQARELQNGIDRQYPGQALHSFPLADQRLDTIQEYRQEIDRLRETIQILHNDQAILRERSLEHIDEYIRKLSELAGRKRSVSGQDPLNLEYYVTLSLMALDDALEISPNYTAGDDQLPLFTAAGNRPDIECVYSSFRMICEVTLLRGRDQWFQEGQPVMRHLREFEDREANRSADNYCLFLAPSIHRDTLNTFWMSVKWGYEGRVQKIVPLTLAQYIRILRIVKERNGKGRRMKHEDLRKLLSEIWGKHARAGNDSTAWLAGIDDTIEQWGASLSG